MSRCIISFPKDTKLSTSGELVRSPAVYPTMNNAMTLTNTTIKFYSLKKDESLITSSPTFIRRHTECQNQTKKTVTFKL